MIRQLGIAIAVPNWELQSICGLIGARKYKMAYYLKEKASKAFALFVPSIALSPNNPSMLCDLH